MQRTLLFKTLIVVGLTLLIGIPLMMIQSTIEERISYREQAVKSIAADSVREQTMLGPLLVIPYNEEFYEKQGPIGDAAPVLLKRSVPHQMLVFPNQLQVNGVIDTGHRYRGIHRVLIYNGQHTFSGDFRIPAKADLPLHQPGALITVGEPFIALSIDDVRGIRDIPTLNWNGRQVDFQQGTGLNVFKRGLHAPLDLTLNTAGIARFDFKLGLDGIEQLYFAPLARNNQVTFSSKWPHPQFGGRFLPSPKTRTISANGFSASWNISALATDVQQQLRRIEESGTNINGAEPLAQLDRFSVGFVEPVNVYTQADRAVKYGLLFVALTFAAFFLFEMLKQLPVHPVQYVLVGLALALFFLLLVSLSEHMAFVTAYLIASGACITLIGFYLVNVLRSWKRGFGFATALTLLYGALYGLLQSENNALVLGSALLFGVLAAIMIATRKVDWYQIGKAA
jgi:inner membrane protein